MGASDESSSAMRQKAASHCHTVCGTAEVLSVRLGVKDPTAVKNSHASVSPCVRLLVSAATVARCGSAEPGLDPGGDKTPDVVAVMGVEQVCGLEPEEGLTRERLGGGSLAEAALLQGRASCGASSVKMKGFI